MSTLINKCILSFVSIKFICVDTTKCNYNSFLCQGGRKYQIKGSTGTGAFAKVYKATVDGNAEEMVALKVNHVSIVFINLPFIVCSSFQRCSLYADPESLICFGILHVSPT